MRHALVIFMLPLFAFAFEPDVSLDELRATKGYLEVNDLAVGDEAYVGMGSLCVGKEGISVRSTQELEDGKLDYGYTLKIKVKPGKRLDAEIVFNKGDDHKKLNRILDALTYIASCNFGKIFEVYRSNGSGFEVEDFSKVQSLPVDTIDGVDSTSQLIEKHKKIVEGKNKYSFDSILEGKDRPIQDP